MRVKRRRDYLFAKGGARLSWATKLQKRTLLRSALPIRGATQVVEAGQDRPVLAVDRDSINEVSEVV